MEAYQSDDLRKAPKGEEYSENHVYGIVAGMREWQV